jgi:hypothetical protein
MRQAAGSVRLRHSAPKLPFCQPQRAMLLLHTPFRCPARLVTPDLVDSRIRTAGDSKCRYSGGESAPQQPEQQNAATAADRDNGGGKNCKPRYRNGESVEGPNRPGTLAGLAHQALRPEPAAQACEAPVRASQLTGHHLTQCALRACRTRLQCDGMPRTHGGTVQWQAPCVVALRHCVSVL